VNLNSRLDIPVAASLRSAAPARAKRETAEICRDRAAADLLASVAMINVHQRQRMETSAAMWTERAQMLQRVEDGLARRTAETAAKRLVIGDTPDAGLGRL
jgi:hypothetical protein